MAQEDVIPPYTIGDKEGYIEFITKLREKLAKRKEGTDIVDDIFEEDGTNGAHPLLVEKPGGKQSPRWIHVELHAANKGKGRWTTLAVRKDNLYIKGFMNKDEKWFELPGQDDDWKLPRDYDATMLKGWDVSYPGLMKLNDKDQVKKALESTGLGKAFAIRAVRRLSRYPALDDNDDIPVRLGLAGLFVMICEAARMNPFLDTIAGGWNVGSGLTTRLADIMWEWGSMSAALLKWKKSGHKKWPVKCNVTLGHALASVHLVLDSKDVTGSGPTWVEILAVSANFDVCGITVIDEGTRPHIIYNKQQEKRQQDEDTEHVQAQQADQGMRALKLTVPGKRISGYRWLDIEIAIPGPADDSIKMRWDCRKLLKGGGEGDATQFVTRAINLDYSSRIDITYLVMSNAVKATVEVKPRLQVQVQGDPADKATYSLPNGRDGGDDSAPAIDQGRGGSAAYTVGGKIAARISDSKAHEIVLFSEEGVRVPHIMLPLPLAQSEVLVPRGMKLHIDIEDMCIESCCSNDRDPETVKKSGSLTFDIGSSRPTSPAMDASVPAAQVNVTWDTQEKKQTIADEEPVVVVCIIGDKNKFATCIKNLRRELARHPEREDVLDGYSGDALPDTGKHPVLARPRAKQPPRWIHVKLQLQLQLQAGAAGEETASTTTLAIRNDKCYGAGFINQSGVWYDLGNRRGDKALPPQYNSVLLDWGVSYKAILGIQEWDEARKQLESARLGKDFATEAVRTLSRYPDVEEGGMSTRLALAGLTIMVCESAKLNTLQRHFEDGWDAGATRFPRGLMDNIINWGEISGALLHWQHKGFGDMWPRDAYVDEIEVSDPIAALGIIHLVFNVPRRKTSSLFSLFHYAAVVKERF